MTEAAAAGVVVPAPAKINLYLHVTGRRDDGYHVLDSLIAFADLGDTIAVAPGDGLALAVDGPFAPAVPAGGDNLVLRAARALAEAAGASADAAIRLTKRLPAAAGIGGGSADAAAALKALATLWGVRPAAEDLARLGLALGADVPVCLAGVPAFVGGIGETIDPAPALPPSWLVLANPGVEVPTPAVFARRRGPFSDPARFAAPPADARALAGVLAARRNDLEPAAREVAPVVAEALAALSALPQALLARMSGSGATCLALFADEGAAEAAAGTLAAARPGWWVRATALATGGPVAAP